jgi:sporulation protein YlmC with PRC-barrel domain
MKRHVITVACIALFMLIIGIEAFADQQNASPGASSKPAETTLPAMPSTDTQSKTGPRVNPLMKAPRALYASTLIGASVKSPTGESLGKIDELVIDPQQAQIKTAVVSMGGVLGIGARTVAVPWSAVQLDMNDGSVTVAKERADLEKAPDWKKPEKGQSAAHESAVLPSPASRPGSTH